MTKDFHPCMPILRFNDLGFFHRALRLLKSSLILKKRMIMFLKDFAAAVTNP